MVLDIELLMNLSATSKAIIVVEYLRLTCHMAGSLAIVIIHASPVYTRYSTTSFSSKLQNFIINRNGNAQPHKGWPYPTNLLPIFSLLICSFFANSLPAALEFNSFYIPLVFWSIMWSYQKWRCPNTVAFNPLSPQNLLNSTS